MFIDTERDVYAHEWINYIKNILQSVGRIDIWTKPSTIRKVLKLKIHEILKGQELQLLQAQMGGSSKGTTLRIFNHNISFKSYLKLLPESFHFSILKFRTSNHKLPIERGRWENVDHAERKCLLCQPGNIDDDYLFECSFFETPRQFCLPAFYTERTNTYKFDLLFNSSNTRLLKNLSILIRVILKSFP